MTRNSLRKRGDDSVYFGGSHRRNPIIELYKDKSTYVDDGGGELLQLVQKIKIFPTPEQEAVLWQLSETCRLLYNYALGERKTTWEQRGESISYLQQQNALPELKNQFP